MRLNYRTLYDKSRRYIMRRDNINDIKIFNKVNHYPELTSAQKKEIKDLYKSLGFPVDYNYHRFLSGERGEFSVDYIPEWLYRSYIEPAFMKTDFSYAWEDKCFMQRFVPLPIFPRSILRSCGGLFYDDNFEAITKEQAIKKILNEPEMVLKYGSSSHGSGVKHIIDTKEFAEKIDSYGTDYLLQERIFQHPNIASLNESSVNIMRIITFRHDGNYDVLTAHLRIGEEGVFTDNGGSNIIHVGIEEDGSLREEGHLHFGGKVYNTSCGKKLKGVLVPSFKEAKKTAIEGHKYLPYSDLIGWDIAIDRNCKPVVIEYNIKSQGIYGSQFVNGPLFGKYTKMVLEKASKYL